MLRTNCRQREAKARKQLLVAESGLNRHRVIGAVVAIAAGVHTLATSLGSLATAAVVLAGRSGFSARPAHERGREGIPVATIS